ncbi:peptidyl-prolyl cis-trans isomerase [Aureococcus anophagefferens]|nr:peptidyl-prolyl cis-trans isomerase [Aureococcus anophagefferens]
MAPKTVKNFKALCTGECGLGATTKKPLHYKGCPVHRVIPGFMIQGGDFSNKNGTGGESIYGGKFADEPFAFFVTLAPTPHLDNKHVCFGEVSGGMEIIRAVEKVDTYRRDEPAAAQRVLITDCGVKREGQDFETAVAARDAASQKKKEKKEKKKSKKEAKKKAEKKAKKDAKKAAKKQAKDEKKKAKKQEKEPENDTPRSRAPESNGGRYYPADRPRADSYGDRPRSGDRPRADSYGDRPRSGDRPRADSYGDRPRADSTATARARRPRRNGAAAFY